MIEYISDSLYNNRKPSSQVPIYSGIVLREMSFFFSFCYVASAHVTIIL